jgi:hypothetical protein
VFCLIIEYLSVTTPHHMTDSATDSATVSATENRLSALESSFIETIGHLGLAETRLDACFDAIDNLEHTVKLLHDQIAHLQQPETVEKKIDTQTCCQPQELWTTPKRAANVWSF